MKRRGFLGFLGGAAVAGPGMVKQAAAQGLAELSLPIGLGNSIAGDYAKLEFAGQTTYSTVASGLPWHLQKWDAFQKLVGSADRLAKRKRETSVHQLDPDLVNCRSFSLAAKIRIQRERNFNAWLAKERTWFDRVFEFGIESTQADDWY